MQTIPKLIVILAVLASFSNLFPEPGYAEPFSIQRPDPEKVLQIINTAEILEAGKPFNQSQMLLGSGFSTYLIGQEIVKLHKQGKLAPQFRKESLSQIIKTESQKFVESIEGMNFWALQEKNPEANAASLMAAFILAGQFQYLENFKPFLQFCDIYYGKTQYAKENPAFSISLLDPEEPSRKLTPEERLNFWPAAKAIVSNPTQSIPPLMDYVLASEEPLLLRVRAAAFLHQLAPEILANLKEQEDFEPPKMTKLLDCLITYDMSWREVWDNMCHESKHQEQMEAWLERFRNRK